jgi:DeoR family transcriptional regulator of aga operon
MLSDNKQETASRRAKMLAQLEENGQLSVKKLSRSFNVSEVTIRNDLNYLEKNNFLIRSRGGALKNQRVGLDFKLNEKSKQHLPEKQAIGRRAAELIKEGDTIILDSGTTTMEIAKNLSNFDNLTVITNALNIAGYLSGYGNIKIIMLGGYLRANSLSLVGPMAESALHH